MTDNELLARVDERTMRIEKDMIAVKLSHEELHSSFNVLQNVITRLQTEHAQNMKNCIQNVYPQRPRTFKDDAVMGGAGGGTVGTIGVIIFLAGKLLGWW